MTLEEYLARTEPDYDPEQQAPASHFKSPGYHTRIPDGARVHPTRDGLRYAVALLASGTPEHLRRAEMVFRRILAAQDTDPAHDTYGIWPWLLEEPLDQMARPDWNWADFCGGELATALILYPDRLPPELAGDLRAGLGHAARAIVRRNVGPSYTNIALAGAAVTAAAGEILEDSDLLDYGRRRLERFIEYTVAQGGFNEYNSPGYGIVNLHWCEWMARLLRDPAMRRCAEEVRTMAWKSVAEHFHPGTGQWAGPHSRNYHDRLARGAVDFLRERTGIDLPLHPAAAASSAAEYNPIPALPAPPELAARFRRLPREPLTIRRRFIRRDNDEESTWGVTWFAEDACLGSVNHDTLWVQRRPLIGYWRTAADPAVVFRVRFLHDGRDFASGHIRCAQDGPRVLLGVDLLTNQGDWHPTLDRPPEATFEAADFRVRFEVNGRGSEIEAAAARRFELRAGNRRIMVHAGDGRFAAAPLGWESGREGDTVFADAVWYSGPRRPFAFRDLAAAWMVAGVECLTVPEPAAASAPQVAPDADSGLMAAAWDVGEGLRVHVARRPRP